MDKKISVVLIIALLMTLALAGCGGSPSEPAEIETPDNSQTPVAEEPVSQDGGNIVMVVEQDIDYLDPHLAAASGTEEILFNIFEGLMHPDSTGAVYPAVAESYDISDDGLTYTFTLREGIKFHNGEPVTIEDVKYTMDRIMGTETGTPLRSELANVASVETPDDSTIVFTLNQRDSAFLSNLYYAKIVPKTNEENFNTFPIGTGPFKFAEYLPEQRVVIEKFEDYWQEGVPHLDQVEFRIIPDREAALLSLQLGEIDMFPRLPIDRVAELGEGFKTIEGSSNMVQLMPMNNNVEPFDDIRVRQAVNYAVDVDEIIEAVAFGYGRKLGSNMSPVMAKYYKEGLENTYDYDPDKAIELLTEAGYPDGFDLTITIPSNYQFHVDTGQVIFQQLANVGIDVEIELVEWGVWLERVYQGREYQATIIAFTGKLDAYKVLNKYISTDRTNFFNFENAEVDELMAAAAQELDDEAAVEMYKRVQEIITENAPAVYIMDPEFSIAMKENISGYVLYPMYAQDMSTVYFE